MRLTIPILLFALLVAPTTASAKPCEPEDRRSICKQHDIYLMPGGHAVFFAPHAPGVEPFFGGGVTLAPILWSHNTDDFGPSQGTLYFQASLLRSASTPASLGLFEGGFTLSFERNSSRRFGIPYFGLGTGVTLHDELPDAGYVYPMGGVHVVWHENFVLDLEGGYHFPFEAVDQMRGPRVELVAQFSMW